MTNMTLTEAQVQELQQLQAAGNYTTFYFKLYKAGSEIAGLYTNGPTGYGVFGQYSHTYSTQNGIDPQTFRLRQTEISETISRAIFDEIVLNGPTPDGLYEIPDAQTITDIEIFAWENDLQFNIESYAGHDLRDFLGWDGVDPSLNPHWFTTLSALGVVTADAIDRTLSDDNVFRYRGQDFSYDVIEKGDGSVRDGVVLEEGFDWFEHPEFGWVPAGRPAWAAAGALLSLEDFTDISDYSPKDISDVFKLGIALSTLGVIEPSEFDTWVANVEAAHGSQAVTLALSFFGATATTPVLWSLNALLALFLNPPVSPLVLDLDGDGIELTSVDGATAFFDVDVDGFAEATGWVAADDGLLAYDINGNGRIDDGAELFGDQTGHANGFLALAVHDLNGDGLIDAQDAVFDDLIIWQDLNADGISQSNEMRNLVEVGISSISLATSSYVVDPRDQLSGNDSIAPIAGTFERADGTSGRVLDVFFEIDPIRSVAVLPNDFEFHPDVFKLPALAGMGHLESTWIAMSQDASLRQQAIDLVQLASTGDILGFLSAFRDYLYAWTGVDDVSPSSRGTYVDGRDLAFLEIVLNDVYVQLAGTNAGTNDPGHNAGELLTLGIEDLFKSLAQEFLSQVAVSNALLNATDAASYAMLVKSNPLSGLTAELGPGAAIQSTLDAFAFADGEFTAANAAQVLDLLETQSGMSQAAFQALASETAVTDGRPEVVQVVTLMDGYDGTRLLGGTEGNDTLSTTVATIIAGNAGDDMIMGSNAADMFLYAAGDGSDTIVNGTGSHSSARDTFRFTDLNIEEVRFSQNAGGDLVMTTANGETVTVQDHFTNEYLDLYTIKFADGTVLSQQAIVGRVAFDGTSHQIEGTDATDWLSGGAQADTVLGHGGDDYLRGAFGADSLIGGAGNDTMDGGLDDDFLNGGLGDDSMIGGAGNDTLLGGAGADTMFGNDGDDVVNGGGGNDVIDAGAGNDTLVGGNNDDIMIGGTGIDIVNYGVAIAGIDVSLARGDASGGGGNDDLSEIEQIIASAHDDRVTGNSDDNVMWGQQGNDTLIGGNGSDTIYGGDGDDRIVSAGHVNGSNHVTAEHLEGVAGDDTIYGSDGNDVIEGGADNDLLFGNAGDDTINGGNGIDRISYSYATGAVTVDLAVGMASGADGNDVLSLIERAEGSNGFGDVLIGNQNANVLYGLGGSDSLDGGTGNDTLWGGAGDDTFVFSAGLGHDRIADFSRADGDLIDLSTLAGVTDISDLTFDVQNGDTTIRFDLDTDMVPDADISITVVGQTLTSTDGGLFVF